MTERRWFNRYRQPSRLVVTATLTWLALSYVAAVAQVSDQVASCLDEVVDVYLSPLLREEGPPIRIFLKPGLPPVHLRLPRRQLGLDLMPNVFADTDDCAQKVFSGWRASYALTSKPARNLKITYDQPNTQDGSFYFYSVDPEKLQNLLPPPLDDSSKRESMANTGAWIVDPDYRGPKQLARFCLAPPAPAKLCYAAVSGSMNYRTGLTVLQGDAFNSATFGLPPGQFMKQITVADLDRYFTFMRRIADAVIVPPTQPAP